MASDAKRRRDERRNEGDYYVGSGSGGGPGDFASAGGFFDGAQLDFDEDGSCSERWFQKISLLVVFDTAEDFIGLEQEVQYG